MNVLTCLGSVQEIDQFIEKFGKIIEKANFVTIQKIFLDLRDDLVRSNSVEGFQFKDQESVQFFNHSSRGGDISKETLAKEIIQLLGVIKKEIYQAASSMSEHSDKEDNAAVINGLLTATQNNTKMITEMKAMLESLNVKPSGNVTGSSSSPTSYKKKAKKAKRKRNKKRKISSSSEWSTSDSDGDRDLKFFSKSGLVSRKKHPWIKHSISLNSSKLRPISCLGTAEIESYISQFVKLNMYNPKYKSRCEAYMSFLCESSGLRVIERFTNASINEVVQYSINQIDMYVIEGRDLSGHVIEQLFQCNLYKYGIDRSKFGQQKSSSSDIKQNKRPYLNLCQRYNKNKTCSDTCTYVHNCKSCYLDRGEKKSHQPKDCPFKKNFE